MSLAGRVVRFAARLDCWFRVKGDFQVDFDFQINFDFQVNGTSRSKPLTA